MLSPPGVKGFYQQIEGQKIAQVLVPCLRGRCVLSVMMSYLMANDRNKFRLEEQKSALHLVYRTHRQIS